MTIVAVDDTDSREDGMCTTYVATRLAERLGSAGGRVERRLLVRLNPAVKHKTRGNAAVALWTSGIDAEEAFAMACKVVGDLAIDDDPRTSPGVVVADVDADPAPDGDVDPSLDVDADPAPDGDVDPSLDVDADPAPDVKGTDHDRNSGHVGIGKRAAAIPDDVAAFARNALRRRLSIDEAVALAEAHGYLHAGFGSAEKGDDDERGEDERGDGGRDDGDAIGRGRIGALAAIGAPAAFDDWTVERISYREFHRCGTSRDVDAESVFAAAEEGYPIVWDTVDRGTGEVVCVPNAPGPILHGIRGDDADACRAVAEGIVSEPVDRAATFFTNQGTDAHLEDGRIGTLRDGAGYRVDGTVASEPVTKRGGHVHVDVAGSTNHGGDGSLKQDESFGEPSPLRCLAFKPTGRFRDRVRALRPGDRVTCCGECEIRPLEDGSEGRETIKLEKFAVRKLVRTEPSTPGCPECGRRMSSAGRDQGYRCRDCGTDAPGRVRREVERELSVGWYEVPPAARRHVAKPLIRGGFDGPINPEK